MFETRLGWEYKKTVKNFKCMEVRKMAESRLIGTYPVIGIRPTIDGRRGYLKVRESLEEQTMNMARSAEIGRAHV